MLAAVPGSGMGRYLYEAQLCPEEIKRRKLLIINWTTNYKKMVANSIL